MVAVNLKRILDEKALWDFRQLFYQFTGMFTCLYIPGAKKGLVDFVPANATLEFCRIIQSRSEGMRRCVVADQRIAEVLGTTRKPIIGPCWAGISGIAVPIHFRDSYLGAIYGGDFLTYKPYPERFGKMSRKLKDLDLDLKALRRAYYEIPVIPPSTVKMACDMLSLIVNYVVDREQIIELQETIYQKQKELAKTLSQNVHLEKGLEEQLNEVRRLRQHVVAAIDKDLIITEDETTRRRRIVQEALSYIDNYYNEGLTLQDVAECVNLSPTYFSGLFRKEMKCTFIDYLVQKRMTKACELLQDLRLNITQVSMQVGYYNLSYFNQVFKRVVGMTPSTFRNCVLTKQADGESSTLRNTAGPR